MQKPGSRPLRPGDRVEVVGPVGHGRNRDVVGRRGTVYRLEEGLFGLFARPSAYVVNLDIPNSDALCLYAFRRPSLRKLHELEALAEEAPG